MTLERLAEAKLLCEALTAILTASRGDEKSECRTIRKFLDDHGVFNGDIGGTMRLIEEACKAALCLTGEEPKAKIRDTKHGVSGHLIISPPTTGEEPS